MKKKEKHNNFKVINVLPAGTELADGTILDKETEFTSEEFRKNPMVLREDHPVNRFIARLIKEKLGLD